MYILLKHVNIQYLLTVCICWWSFMTQTIRTIICNCTWTTAIPTVKVTICIVGFIIAISIANQIKWNCTVQIFITVTFSTIICVDIRSTTITSIIVAFCSICSIIAITVIYLVRDFTALKIYTKLKGDAMNLTVTFQNVTSFYS